ncbi:PRD domain-containing protein [Tetragenococcus halophilus]|uniref:PRD domain-containing protein n=1 Tax=Tetragenococcus halophilus TaxID=51669 RepID=UPI00209AA1D5|nr:PRD domain-containing protein [Tetragenococcus halophilus]MCO8292572.1 PRD domain-containing protein [Tetragenococcus halophilus]
MKVIKNINNNVSLCMDSTGREVIAFGKGIGFIKPPHEISLGKVERTFYNINEFDFEVIKNIPVSVMKAAIRIVDEVESNLNITLMSTTTIALADHINFAIKRQKKAISLDLTLQEDIKQTYRAEMDEAYKAIEIINKETNIMLDKKEAATIALHFINNQIDEEKSRQNISEDIIQDSICIIESEFGVSINKKSFNYSRFVTHMNYLLRRSLKDSQIQSSNSDFFEKVKEEHPITYKCTVEINQLFRERLGIELNDEENLYFMLHVNRLYSRDLEVN